MVQLRPHVLQEAWEQDKAAVGVEVLTIHDLRHSGNTWAAATGASTKELMALAWTMAWSRSAVADAKADAPERASHQHFC